jgi:hypothetical protein
VKTVFRPQFWVDLADGVAYLAENASPEIARRWHAEVMATVSGLEHWPNMASARSQPAGYSQLGSPALPALPFVLSLRYRHGRGAANQAWYGGFAPTVRRSQSASTVIRSD